MSHNFIGRVRDAYDSDPQAEWSRLEGRVQNRIEYLITSRILERALQSLSQGALVLDAGSGPGRYARDLARCGHSVTMVDLSRRSLALAGEMLTREPEAVRRRVAGRIEGSFTSMPYFRSGVFEAVVSLGGAVSHVVDPAMRREGISELGRVARPGAPIVISVGNRLSGLRGGVIWPDAWESSMESVRTGHGELANGSPYVEFWPDEVEPMLRSAGLHAVEMFGCQGIAAHLQPERLESLMADEKRWREWEAWLLGTASQPSIVGLSCHLIAVASRPT